MAELLKHVRAPLLPPVLLLCQQYLPSRQVRRRAGRRFSMRVHPLRDIRRPLAGVPQGMGMGTMAGVHGDHLGG